MSFWSALKTSWTWLRDGAVWAWSWIGRRPAAAAAMFGVVLLATVTVYRMSPEIGEWMGRADVGQIIVNSPTVYTRQRLVNDRLSQTQWLEKELKKADHDFHSIAQVRKGLLDRAIKIGDPPTSPSTTSGIAATPTTSGGSASPNTPSEQGNVSLTTAALFRAKNSFREEVRAEMTQTQLDDRHDIQGNTIYRLAFDATVLAGTKANTVAAVKVTIGHHPNGKPPARKAPRAHAVAAVATNNLLQQLYKDDYQQLYLDWIRYTQTLIERSVSGIASSISLPKPDPRVRPLLTRFLLARICEFSLGITNLGDNFAKDCDPEQHAANTPGRRAAEHNQKRTGELLDAYVNDRFSLLADNGQKKFFEDMERLDKLGYETGPDKEQQWMELAQLYCRALKLTSLSIDAIAIPKKPPPPSPQIGASNDNKETQTKSTENPSEPKDRGGKNAVPAKADAPQQITPAPAPPSPKKEFVACPFYDSPEERLISGILLYSQLYDFEHPQTPAKEFDENLKNKLIDKLNSLELSERNCKNAMLFEQNFCQYPNQESARRCFAADFVKADLNRSDRRPGTFLPMSRFLKLEISGREINDCRLIVSPLPDSENPVRQLESALNTSTETFAYSISPKNLTENISTFEESRDAFETLLRLRSSLDDKESSNFFGSLLRRRSDQVQATLPYPLVVGFGSSRLIGTGKLGVELVDRYESSVSADPASALLPKKSAPKKFAAIRTAIVGWIIAPRLRVDRRPEQIDGQHALTAVISVPSWWRSVELDIETCWISREELRKLSPGEMQGIEICRPGEAQMDRTVIRLPGVIQELSRKLGFEVVQEPYLSEDIPQRLDINEPGYLLLGGGRLWRSTEVTIGSQKADSITVLPNMEGIVAKFNCVLPQSGDYRDGTGSAEGKKVTVATLRVWTSEGVTPPGSVELVWPVIPKDIPATAGSNDNQGRRPPKYCAGWYDDIARPVADAPRPIPVKQ